MMETQTSKRAQESNSFILNSRKLFRSQIRGKITMENLVFIVFVDIFILSRMIYDSHNLFLSLIVNNIYLQNALHQRHSVKC